LNITFQAINVNTIVMHHSKTTETMREMRKICIIVIDINLNPTWK